MNHENKTKEELIKELDAANRQVMMYEKKQKEQQAGKGMLYTSEAPFLTIMEAAPDPIVIYDLEGKVTYLNPSFTRVFGWTLDELLSKRIDFVPEDSRKDTTEAVERTLKGETVEYFETKRFTKDKRIINIQASAAMFRDQAENTVGIVVILRDISEKQHMEEALRKSEEMYRTVMEAVADPIVVYDMEGRVVYFNPAFTQVFGWRLEERLGKKFDDFVPDENWAETRMMIDNVQTGKQFVAIESQRYDKYRQKIPVSISGANYRDKKGDLMGSVINLRNNTKRKLAEEALKDSHKILDSILSASPIGIGLVENEAFVWVNRQMLDLFGFEDEADIQRKKIQSVFHSGEDYQNVSKQLLRQLKKSKIANTDVAFTKRDGSKFMGYLSVSNLGGRIPIERIIFAITDITWRHCAEQDRLEREKLQAIIELAGAVCHELNQPLQILSSISDLINLSLAEQGGFSKEASKINEQVQRMAKIIHQLTHITTYETKPYLKGVNIIDIEKAST